MSQRDTARILFEVATVPFILGGGVHALGALIDTRRPTFFETTKEGLSSEMLAAGVRLRGMFPGTLGRSWSLWRAWLGFNISHGLGAATFGLTMLILALHNYRLVQQISAIHPLAIAASAAYFLVSLRYWFYAPTAWCGRGLGCFIAATAVA
jgi:hypothetical protein